MKRTVFSIGLAFLLFNFSLWAEEEKKAESVEIKTQQQVFPFVGKIKGRKVNIRGGGNTNYEILATMEEGQPVIVLSEAYDWYQIVPPEGLFLWINQNYLDEKNQVTTDRVNVRNAASLYGTVNCQVSQGATVEKIDQAGEWVKIKPPQGASAWIHKNFVLYEKPYEQHLQEVNPETKIELLDARKNQLIKEAEAFEKSEFEKPVDQIQFDAIIQKYESILKEYAEEGELETIIDQKIENLKQRKTTIQAESLKVIELVKAPVEDAGSENQTVKETPLQTEITEEEIVEVKAETQKDQPLDQASLSGESPQEIKSETLVSETRPYEVFEGRLEMLGGLGESSKRFKLIHHYRRVCVVTGNPVELRKYLHHNVRIQGVIISRIYTNVPVVEVQQIELYLKE